MTLAATAMLIQGPEVVLVSMTLVGSMALAWKLLGPLAQALARRIEARGASGSGAELEELRFRVQELESQQARVVELEERLDFAERVLARQRPEPGRIGMGEDQA